MPHPQREVTPKMKKTFHAKEPGRYVSIEYDVILRPDESHKIKNAVTGYKMIVDMDTGQYDSFITEIKAPDWHPHSVQKQLKSWDEFWVEVNAGHLFLSNEDEI
jgi:hypothetical protein